MTEKIRTFRYVGYHDVPAYLELGWTAPECRPHRHMDRYRVIMEWPFDREAVEPMTVTWRKTTGPMGQFEAAAWLRDQRDDTLASVLEEYDRAAEDAQRRQDARDGFDE